jgi:hypothetical protein
MKLERVEEILQNFQSKRILVAYFFRKSTQLFLRTMERASFSNVLWMRFVHWRGEPGKW